MSEAGADSPHLEEAEQHKAADHAPLPARIIHEIIRDEGEEMLERQTGALLWSGLAAGLSMGFSFLVEAAIRGALPEARWCHLVESVGYSTGFAIVILGKQQLFTESTLSAVLPVLTRRTTDPALSCLRLWAYVFLSNIVGTWIFAALLAYGRPFEGDTAAALASLAQAAIGQKFWPTALEGMLAGWLIALMAWLMPSGRGERLAIIVFVTTTVALLNLSHVIAGSAEAAYAVLAHGAPLSAYLGAFLAPTLLGNIVGGVLLVAILNHAPLAPELEGAKEG
jgi:formate/nitrite transporter FocA (FNT family)